MSILKILQYPDSRLRRKGYKVESALDPKIQKIIQNMTETLLVQTNCAGLSATQLDIENPPNITVIYTIDTSDEKNISCLINPEITETEGNVVDDEACMSVLPNSGIYAKVKRAKKIKVKTLTSNNELTEFEAEDFFARCIQHEIDHLQGILYIDHLSKLKRSFIEKKIAKLQ